MAVVFGRSVEPQSLSSLTLTTGARRRSRRLCMGGRGRSPARLWRRNGLPVLLMRQSVDRSQIQDLSIYYYIRDRPNSSGDRSVFDARYIYQALINPKTKWPHPLFISLFLRPTRPFFSLGLCLSLPLSVYLSLSPSVSISVSVSLSVSLSLYVSVSLSVCLSLWMIVNVCKTYVSCFMWTFACIMRHYMNWCA